MVSLSFLEKFLAVKDKVIHYLKKEEAIELINNIGAATVQYPDLKDFGIVTITEKGISVFGLAKYTSLNVTLSKLKSDKDEERVPEKTIRVESLEEAKSYDEVEEESTHISVEKDLVGVINSLNPDFKALILIAKKIEALYSNKPIDEALVFKWKKYVANAFKNLDGIKFLDMYSYGYITGFLKEYKELAPEILNQKLIELLTLPIFFINRGMHITDLEIISMGILSELYKQTKYIAVHSLGSATESVKQLFTDEKRFGPNSVYKRPVIDNIDKISNLPEYSIIWYTIEGKQIYNYVS